MTVGVRALRIDDRAARLATPGGFKYGRALEGERPCGMHFTCPCGCGRDGWLPFRPESSPSWEWDGDRDAPTLRPSVLQVGGCGWHGWLRAGVWVPC